MKTFTAGVIQCLLDTKKGRKVVISLTHVRVKEVQSKNKMFLVNDKRYYKDATNKVIPATEITDTLDSVYLKGHFVDKPDDEIVQLFLEEVKLRADEKVQHMMRCVSNWTGEQLTAQMPPIEAIEYTLKTWEG